MFAFPADFDLPCFPADFALSRALAAAWCFLCLARYSRPYADDLLRLAEKVIVVVLGRMPVAVFGLVGPADRRSRRLNLRSDCPAARPWHLRLICRYHSPSSTKTVPVLVQQVPTKRLQLCRLRGFAISNAKYRQHSPEHALEQQRSLSGIANFIARQPSPDSWHVNPHATRRTSTLT